MSHRPHQRSVLLAALTVTTAVTLAACSSATPVAEVDATDSSPQSGGDLALLSQGPMTCLDPWQGFFRSDLQWQRQMQDSLIFQDADGAFHPWLAESFEANDDATEFRFVLRDDVVFSDGSALDAETVQASLDALSSEPVYAVARSLLTNYTETVVEDEFTAVVTFSEPNASFLDGISTPNLSITSTASAAIGPTDRCAGEAAGSGPFILDDIRPGERLVLVRNDDYAWAPPELENQGAPYLDSITVNQVLDPMVVAQTAIAGDVDAAFGVLDAMVPELEAEGWTRIPDPDPGTSPAFISFPGRGIMGTDENVRRAFGLALDREEIVAAAGTDSIFEPSGVLTTSHPFFTDQSDSLEHNVEEAIELLEDAGWELGEDGIRERDGQRLSIETVLYSTPPGPDMISVAAQQLEEVGIELTLRPVTFAEDAAVRAEGTMELRVSGQTGSDPTVLPYLFDGDLPDGMAELLAEQNETLDPVERQEIVDELTTMLLDEGWLAPIYQVRLQPWLSPAVQGVIGDVGGLYMMSQTWLTPES